GPSMIEASPFPISVNDGDRSRRLDRLKENREEAAGKRRPLAQVLKLLWQTINSKRAELRVFLANLAKLDIFWIGPPGPNFLHTIPDLNDRALRRVPIKCCHCSCSCGGSADSQEATAGCLDDGLSLRSVLLCIRIRVGHIDFCHEIDPWLCLSVKTLNRE